MRKVTVRLRNGKTRDGVLQGFGRVQHWEVANENYLLGDYIAPTKYAVSEPFGARLVAGIDERRWNDTQWWGDQGEEPACTGFASLKYAEDGPVTQPVSKAGHVVVDPFVWYAYNQTADRQEGRFYEEGATILAACQVAKALKIAGAYYWIRTLENLIRAVLETGPVLAGTEWYPEMSAASRIDGWMPTIRGASRSLGGHAYVINGVDVKREFFWMANSWDRKRFGMNGRARIPFATLEKRLIPEDGEFVQWRELKLTKPVGGLVL
jgi:hypothetical protein